jgi:hypothetical protein
VVTDSAERDRMLQYLTSGTPVLHTTARTRDVLSPAAGQVVPTSFRTDGEWTAVVAANFLLYPPLEHARQAAWTPSG